MAIENVDLGISDADMFRAAMADEPKAEPETQSEERNRDELGRYAKVEDAPAAATQQQPEQVKEPAVPQDKDEAQVPSWRLRELREQREAADERAKRFERDLQREREERQAIERRFQQTQQPQEKVDWFTDPDAAHQQRITPLEQQVNSQFGDLILDNSKTRAMVRYGVHAYDEMENSLQQEIAQRGIQDPELKSLAVRMHHSKDPAEVAMSWYRQNKILRETGGDLAKYETTLQEKLLKDPAFQAKAMEAWRMQASQPGNAPKVQIPPSLNRASGSAGNEQADGGDMSNESLWAAVRPNGRRK